MLALWLTPVFAGDTLEFFGAPHFTVEVLPGEPGEIARLQITNRLTPAYGESDASGGLAIDGATVFVLVHAEPGLAPDHVEVVVPFTMYADPPEFDIDEEHTRTVILRPVPMG